IFAINLSYSIIFFLRDMAPHAPLSTRKIKNPLTNLSPDAQPVMTSRLFSCAGNKRDSIILPQRQNNGKAWKQSYAPFVHKFPKVFLEELNKLFKMFHRFETKGVCYEKVRCIWVYSVDRVLLFRICANGD
ncbi:MAG: hypothetical protein LBK44_03555, partial [Spirochaetales bacterium]|nr:hypothetical protein [Spirochaetales bacterium]